MSSVLFRLPLIPLCHHEQSPFAAFCYSLISSSFTSLAHSSPALVCVLVLLFLLWLDFHISDVVSSHFLFFPEIYRPSYPLL